jgi:hypothetical protein
MNHKRANVGQSQISMMKMKVRVKILKRRSKATIVTMLQVMKRLRKVRALIANLKLRIATIGTESKIFLRITNNYLPGTINRRVN